MASVDVDLGAGGERPRSETAEAGARGAGPETGRPPGEPLDIEVEREVTKRQIVQAATTVIVVLLYMIFSLLRDRDAGVVVLGEEGEENGWSE